MITEKLKAKVDEFLDSGPKKLLINGKWESSSSGNVIETTDPATKNKIAEIAAGNADDVDRAVSAARQAFVTGEWPAMTPEQRSQVIWRIADLIDKYADELAQLETLDNGKPITVSKIDVTKTANMFRYYAGWPTKILGDVNPISNKEHLNYTVREPVGVVGQIIPWNYPMLMASWKLAPALAAGTTIVLKPAELTSLTAIRLGEIFVEAGLPAGVVNIITGTGETAGAAIANHPGIDKVAFTGSTEVGKTIMKSGADKIKRISLELGGKSPNIIFVDADIEKAVAGACEGIFYNMGQDCAAGSRVFVERPVYDQVVEMIAQKASELKVGNGFNEEVEIGPLISEEQLNKVFNYVSSGIEEGAKLITGGRRLTTAPYSQGYFIEPTVLANVRNDMTVAQEEIFGPVVSIIPFDGVDEAIKLANETVYGLGSAVWTENIRKAHQVVRALKAGMVWVNSYGVVDPTAPFGGFKMSGYGREMGFHAIELYTEIKSVWLNVGQ